MLKKPLINWDFSSFLCSVLITHTQTKKKKIVNFLVGVWRGKLEKQRLERELFLLLFFFFLLGVLFMVNLWFDLNFSEKPNSWNWKWCQKQREKRIMEMEVVKKEAKEQFFSSVCTKPHHYSAKLKLQTFSYLLHFNSKPHFLYFPFLHFFNLYI